MMNTLFGFVVGASVVGLLWFARPPRRCCPHTNQRGIYGDEINAVGGKRAECLDCGCLLTSLPPDGSARPSTSRRES